MRITELREDIQTFGKGEIKNVLPRKTLYAAYDNIPYFLPNEADSEMHIAYWDNNKILGLTGVQENPYNPEELWVKFISVRKDFRNKGIATKLVKELFEFAQNHGYELKLSSYTELGGQYLPSVFDKVSQQYPNVTVKS